MPPRMITTTMATRAKPPQLTAKSSSMARDYPGRRSVPAAELAVVPRGARHLAELERDALGRLAAHHLDGLLGQLAPARVARHQLEADARDRLDVAVQHRLGAQHHPAQLVVAVAA